MVVCIECETQTPVLAWVCELVRLFDLRRDTHSSIVTSASHSPEFFIQGPTNTDDDIIRAYDPLLDTMQWHAERRRHTYNASAMASICCANQYEAPIKRAIYTAREWKQQQDFLHTGIRHPQSPDQCPWELPDYIHEAYAARMYHIGRGNDLEDEAKEAFCRETGHRLIPISDKIIFSNRRILGGDLAATPDGITFCGGILETKVPETASHMKVTMYVDQVQANMHIVGAGRGWLYQYQKTRSGKWKAPPPNKLGKKQHKQSISTVTEISNRATGSLLTHIPFSTQWVNEVEGHAVYYHHLVGLWKYVIYDKSLFF